LSRYPAGTKIEEIDMNLNLTLKSFGLFVGLAAGLFGCATSSGPGGIGRGEVQVAPGIPIQRLFQAAVSAGDQMNYSVAQEGSSLVLIKQLPFGDGYFGVKPGRNRITVSPVPGADGAPPGIRVEGKYLGDIRDSNLRNCLPCDVDKIKEAIREAR
jgi:hypothetical protein